MTSLCRWSWPFLAVALLAATTSIQPAGATADGPDAYAVSGVAAGDVLNVRAEPSALARKVGEIPHDGRGLQNLGCTSELTIIDFERMSKAERQRARSRRWCKIRYGTLQGWVAGKFLIEDSGE